MTQPKLDWRPRFDELSLRWHVRAITTGLTPRTRRWRTDLLLDQGNEGACVGMAWTHDAASWPNRWRNLDVDDAFALYHEAQKIDEWPGEDYSGTSVLAGAKIAKRLGRVTDYRWATGLDDVVLSLSHVGSLVLGLWWYESMDEPYPMSDSMLGAHAEITVGGDRRGGHSILANGIRVSWQRNARERIDDGEPWLDCLDQGRTKIRLHNSWGRRYGFDGDVWIALDNYDRLRREDGEACVPTKLAQRAA